MSTRITSGTPWLLSLGVWVAIRAVVIESDEKLINSIDFHDFSGSWARVSEQPVATCGNLWQPVAGESCPLIILMI